MKKTKSTRISEHVLDWLEKEAALRDRSVSWMIAQAVAQVMNSGGYKFDSDFYADKKPQLSEVKSRGDGMA